jgi:hypothetical protein
MAGTDGAGGTLRPVPAALAGGTDSGGLGRGMMLFGRMGLTAGIGPLGRVFFGR